MADAKKRRKDPEEARRLDAIRNLDAERGVLGAILLDGSWFDVVRLKLGREDFFRDAHQVVWDGMCRLADAGVEIEIVALCDLLIESGEYDKIGGDDLMQEIAGSVPHSANVRYHADIVRQKSVTRQVIQTATEIIRDGYGMTMTSAELLAHAESKLLSIGLEGVQGGLRPPEEYVAAAQAQMTARMSGEVTGIETGWPALDALVGGLRRGSLVIVAGRPSMGKTSFALNLCENNSIRPDPHAARHGLFFSLEMGMGDVGERLIVSLAGVNGEKIRAGGQLTSDEFQQIDAASDRVLGSRLHVDEASMRSVAEIGTLARRYQKEHGALDYVCVDYLQLVAPVEGLNSRQEQVAGIARDLKVLAGRLQVPVIVMSQLNRAVEARADKRPLMSDLRESGAIEQDADVILMLHRPEYYDPSDQPGVAEVIVAKNRNGPTGTIDLLYQKQQMRFEPIENMASHGYPPGDFPY